MRYNVLLRSKDPDFTKLVYFLPAQIFDQLKLISMNQLTVFQGVDYKSTAGNG